MANIILAYIIGVLCGVGYMYLKYSKTMQRHLRELEKIRLNNAKIVGELEMLRIVKGVNVEEK